ncbi:hypothetical protein LCGC14_1537000 [marine sediment metagenome]|uniref:Uncharacterized protein n=1 Tax=marine sediment metagenome TaxID=412755 RepID=A0A0F9IU90_9ZZZZ
MKTERLVETIKVSTDDGKNYVIVSLSYQKGKLLSWEITPPSRDQFLFKNGDLSSWRQVVSLIDRAIDFILEKKDE